MKTNFFSSIGASEGWKKKRKRRQKKWVQGWRQISQLQSEISLVDDPTDGRQIKKREKKTMGLTKV